MKHTFVKKIWSAENIIFYIHFEDDYATQQIEMSETGKIRLDRENPVKDFATLTDQSIDKFELKPDEYIDEAEFYRIWKSED
jgi:hypothetical protein